MSESDDEAIFRDAVRRTFKQLDVWRRANGTFAPEPFSPLSEDDKSWPPMAISQVAHGSLAAAVEHLQAIRVHVDVADGAGENLFPLAHQTLVRAALLAAAQAVWLLAPDASEVRLARHRKVQATVYSRHLEYLSRLKTIGDHEGTNTVASQVAKRLDELQQERRDRGEGQKLLVSTRMIEEAARVTFDDELIPQVLLAWQSGSGAAHGFNWSLFGRIGTSQTSPANSAGIAEFSSEGSYGLFGNEYMAAYNLCDQGWKLLRKRSR